jgi:hypothetical protein
MNHIMIRIVTDDYDAWLAVHYEFATTRSTFGMTDGPVYRDIDNPNAAMFHILTADLPRAMEWFQDPRFKEASVRAKVTGREFYIAQQR